MNTSLLNQLRQTSETIGKEFLRDVQAAAAVDAHHYEVLAVKNFKAVPHDTYVMLTGELHLSGKQSADHGVTRGLMDATFERAGYRMEYWSEPDFSAEGWRYHFQVQVDLPTVQVLSLAWDDIEDVTGFAIYEDQDVPTELTWNGTEYLLLKTGDGSADYERKIKQ